MSKLYELLNTLIGKVNKSVKTESQTLTAEQKAQARANIGAASEAEIADSGVPDYVVTESENVLDRVINAQKARTFNLAVITDLHNNGGVSDANILHACQGVGYIADRVKLDAFACLGDHTDLFGSTDWAECLADILACNNHKHKHVRKTDVLELIGNHDFAEKHSPKTYKMISAYNENVVWGSMLGGYFFKDYSDYKLRIICLNTSESAYIGVSPEQYRWFIETLDLSAKEDASEWQTLIMSHVPLDWSGFTVFAYVLQAYINGTTWTNGTYSCDYTGKNQATIIACVHGHIHNLLVDKLYLGDSSTSTEQIDLYRIAMPEATELYGNHYTAPFKQDVRYAKTNGTAKDTSFNVLCIDLDSKKIEAVCYGAGVDRTIEYTAFGDTGEDGATSYTNLLPLSVDTDGSDFVGTHANGGDGYEYGYRLTSSGVMQAQDGFYTTGFIPVTLNDTVRIKNIAENKDSDGTNRIMFYDSSKTYVNHTTLLEANAGITITDDVWTFSPKYWISDEIGFFRFCCGSITDETIVTVNEEITESGATPSYTNRIKASINADDSEYIGHNGEDGYSAGYRVNSSGVEAEQSGMCATGYIPYNGETIRLKNVTVTGTKTPYIAIYKADKTFFQVVSITDRLTDDGNGIYTGNAPISGGGYIRITCGVIDDTSVLTLNEEIV